MSVEFDIVPVEQVPFSQIVTLLQEAFGPRKTEDHLRWKHQDGPWGPASGSAAVRNGEVLGVRLMVPWRLAVGSETRAAARTMDGAVAVSARRLGIFSTLVRHEVARRAQTERWEAIYSTSVPASREAYRRLGWTIFPPQPSVVTLSRWSRARVDECDPMEVVPARGDEQLTTAWDTSSLRWRYDPRSGHDYHALRLAEAAGDQGIVYRLASSRRLRTVVVTSLVGGTDEKRQLVRAVTRHERAPLVVLQAADAGLAPRVRRPVGSGSTVSLTVNHPDALPALDPHSWRFTGADLEGVL